MKARRKLPLPDISVIEEYFDINPCTGSIRWKKRGKMHRLGADAGSISRVRNSPPYRTISIIIEQYNFRIPAAQIIWASKHRQWPKSELDHKDRDSLNDCIDNLRKATYSQQIINQDRKNKTGFKWVRRNITARGKIYYTGKVVAEGGKVFHTSRYSSAK